MQSLGNSRKQSVNRAKIWGPIKSEVKSELNNSVDIRRGKSVGSPEYHVSRALFGPLKIL
jgi:hypothetical protein